MAYGITSVNSLGLIMLVLSCLALFGLARKYAAWPIIFMTCFVALGQRIVLFSLDFNFMRIMIIAGLIRILIRNEFFVIKKHKMDALVILFALTQSLAHLMRDNSALVFELGHLLDIIGTYYIFRCLIQNWDDLYSVVKGFVLISIPLACFFVLEIITGRNIFSVFGGVPDITQFRGGRVRSQGAFAHPILAGVFIAVIMPLIAAGWWGGKKKKWVITGLFTTSVVVIATASSTPIFAVLAGLIGAYMFYFREHMQLIRWGVLSGLVMLHLIMNAPVWHLISRVSAVGGSTSYYRYALIDSTIKRFNEWWLIGVDSNAHWFYGAGDNTNEFARICIDGGILPFLIFVVILALAFRGIGNTWRRQRQNPAKLAMAWGVGVSLFAICASFIGVAVWGQLIVIFWMLIAMIASLELASEKEA